METQKASVSKIAVPYGVTLGVATIILSTMVYALDLTYEQPWWQSVISIVVMIAIIVYGIKAFKKANGGYLSLTEALKVGLAISLISALLGIIFQMLFMFVLEPDFIEKSLDVARDNMLEQNPDMTDEQIEMGMSISETMMKPGILVAIGIIGSLFLGFIFSLIPGLILKTTPRPTHLE